MSRGGAARRAVLVVAFGVLIVALSLVAAYSSSTYIPASTASSTLTLALPGPFSGCPALSSTLNESTRAVLDLTRPSAFQTTYDGQLVGEGGAIVSAELISLSPETVVYTLNNHLSWSNGRAFGPSDLVAWWQRAKGFPGLVGQGYRDIRTMEVARSRTQVTAIFRASSPFTDWNLLFRDVEQTSSSEGCQPSLLQTRPSLGPYRVLSASASRVVLVANSSWPLNYNRFQRVVVEAADTTHAVGSFYVGFSPGVTNADLGALAAHNRYASSFVASPSVLELAFSPVAPLVAPLEIRAGLSWAINRQRVLSRIDLTGGAATATVPTSALYSVLSPLYPLPELGPAIDVHHPNLTGSSLDCVACAARVLSRGGWIRVGGHWSWGGATVVLRVAVGPSEMDHRASQVLSDAWNRLGVGVRWVAYSSENAAARAVATGHVDAGVYTRPLGSSPWSVLSSFVPVGGVIAYPTGVTSPVLTSTLRQVATDFNPQSAATSWEQFDQWLQHQFWIRPLATPPALTLWSGRVGNVQPASSLVGLVDQVANWGVAPPHSVPTTTPTVRTS